MQGWWPKYLNSPIQVLWWETDEILPLAIGIFFSVAFHSWGPLFAGTAASAVLIKMKKRLPKGFLFNLAYRMYLHRMKGMPNFIIKKFVE
jgi:type IV conjugative transfer system protein TraL